MRSSRSTSFFRNKDWILDFLINSGNFSMSHNVEVSGLIIQENLDELCEDSRE